MYSWLRTRNGKRSRGIPFQHFGVSTIGVPYFSNHFVGQQAAFVVCSETCQKKIAHVTAIRLLFLLRTTVWYTHAANRASLILVRRNESWRLCYSLSERVSVSGRMVSAVNLYLPRFAVILIALHT